MRLRMQTFWLICTALRLNTQLISVFCSRFSIKIRGQVLATQRRRVVPICSLPRPLTLHPSTLKSTRWSLPLNRVVCVRSYKLCQTPSILHWVHVFRQRCTGTCFVPMRLPPALVNFDTTRGFVNFEQQCP